MKQHSHKVTDSICESRILSGTRGIFMSNHIVFIGTFLVRFNCNACVLQKLNDFPFSEGSAECLICAISNKKRKL
jgi:hypothetical protein